MAKIYVAENCEDYEGFVIIGVFDNLVDAQWACKMDRIANEKYGTRTTSWRIEELEIGKSYHGCGSSGGNVIEVVTGNG